MAEFNLKILSFNVRGLNNKIKRIGFLEWLKSEHFDICFIQESFSTCEIEDTGRKEWGGGGGHIEFNSGSNNSRGVAILFRPNLDYEITSKYSDNIGRLLWLNIKLKESLCSLVNIYAPNGEAPQIHFYNHLHNFF